MIQEIRIGEIVRIKNREWILTETRIGGSDKLRPDLVLLENKINGIYRKPYFKEKIKNDIHRNN